VNADRFRLVLALALCAALLLLWQANTEQARPVNVTVQAPHDCDNTEGYGFCPGTDFTLVQP